MRNRLGNRDGLLGACQRLVGVAEMPEHSPQEEVAVGAAVKSKTESQGAAPFWSVKSDALLQMHTCSAELAKPEQIIARCMMSVAEQLRVAQVLPDSQQ